MSTFRMWEVFAKADDGPFYKDQGEWMIKSFIPNMRRVVKEHNIKYDGKTIVNQDDDLADRVWEAAKDFFVRYLDAVPNAGYHNPRTDFRSYFLTFADGARLELMNKPGMPDEPKPAARTGYAYIAFSVGSREKVDALTARLKADGCEVLSGPRTTGDGYYESCVLAVEGNQIEITV